MKKINWKRVIFRLDILIGFIVFGIGWRVEDNSLLEVALILLGMFIVEIGYMFDYEQIQKEGKLGSK